MKVSVLPWLHIKSFFSQQLGEEKAEVPGESHAHVTALVRKDWDSRLEMTISGSVN